ncbi:MAG: Na+/H+ antiporter NhaC [Ichthyobacteriaceae bacterium]|nr:Na+/H+ antiporter NhaC [Ichthyobacteriaceae bacterium]
MQKKEISLLLALTPIIVLIPLLSYNVIVFDDTLAGANQMALLLSAGVAGLIGTYVGIDFNTIYEGVAKNIKDTSSAIVILLLIGSLAGTWLISGVVPAMVYYGLQILNPSIFLFATAIISAIVAIATGSSWSTIATLGVALLGIGKALGLPEEVIGGAIISGAYFGDKMSPMSDTTNLAAAMAGTSLFTHIKYMTYTTFPSMAITLTIYLIMGFSYGNTEAVVNTDEILLTLNNTFNITPWLFLVPVIVIYSIIKKVPALPALFLGSLLGGVFALIFQPEILASISGESTFSISSAYKTIIQSMIGDINISTGNTLLDSLLSTSGMAGMLNTVWLIITAMVFGGIMESIGALQKISTAILKLGSSISSLFIATTGTSIFINLTAADQYLAIVVPGRMYSDAYKKANLAPENLSRTLEDSATVTSVLIPWNTCGATQASVLGVATLAYAPYAFFNILSPIMTLIFATFKIKIKKLNEDKDL